MEAPPRRRLLLVEDDGATRALLALALEGEGWRVLTSDHAMDPFDVAQLRPDAVVLDLWLAAGGDGGALLGAMRRTPGTRRTPVVVCTGDRTRAESEADAFAALGATVLLKPFGLDALLGSLSDVATG